MQNLVISKSNLEKGLAADFFFLSEAPSPPKFLCWDGQALFLNLNLVTYISVKSLSVEVFNTTHHPFLHRHTL
jgi:hypothetical protein